MHQIIIGRLKSPSDNECCFAFGQHNENTNKTMTMTKTNTFREHLKNDPRDLWPLALLIRVIRRHDMAQKEMMTKIKTDTNTKKKKKENTGKERSYIPLRYLIRVMRRHDLIKDQIQIQIQRTWQKHDTACELVWDCLHVRQLRTWIHDNNCDLRSFSGWQGICSLNSRSKW